MGYHPRSTSIWLQQQSQPSFPLLNDAGRMLTQTCHRFSYINTVFTQSVPTHPLPQPYKLCRPVPDGPRLLQSPVLWMGSAPAAQSLWSWVLSITNESLKFPLTSGSEATCPPCPLPCNHTRPSAQDMEVAVQNLVSWLIQWSSLMHSDSISKRAGEQAFHRLHPNQLHWPQNRHRDICAWIPGPRLTSDSMDQAFLSQRKKISEPKMYSNGQLSHRFRFPVLIYPK